MTFTTHKRFAISFAYLAVIGVYTLGLSAINYYLSIPLVVLIAKYGALFPDLDHSWANVKEKTTMNRIINALIHLTGGKHRSWQTHSIDIAAGFLAGGLIASNFMIQKELISEVNYEILNILIMAFGSGWLSHLFSDMMTSAGVRLFFWAKFKVAFVPKRLWKLKFNTGHEWEGFVQATMTYINFLTALVCFGYPLIMNPEIMNHIKQLLN